MLPPGLDTWDPSSYLATAAPIWFALLGTNVSHEVGHRVAAGFRWAAAPRGARCGSGCLGKRAAGMGCLAGAPPAGRPVLRISAAPPHALHPRGSAS